MEEDDRGPLAIAVVDVLELAPAGQRDATRDELLLGHGDRSGLLVRPLRARREAPPELSVRTMHEPLGDEVARNGEAAAPDGRFDQRQREDVALRMAASEA